MVNYVNKFVCNNDTHSLNGRVIGSRIIITLSHALVSILMINKRLGSNITFRFCRFNVVFIYIYNQRLMFPQSLEISLLVAPCGFHLGRPPYSQMYDVCLYAPL